MLGLDTQRYIFRRCFKKSQFLGLYSPVKPLQPAPLLPVQSATDFIFFKKNYGLGCFCLHCFYAKTCCIWSFGTLVPNPAVSRNGSFHCSVRTDSEPKWCRKKRTGLSSEPSPHRGNAADRPFLQEPTFVEFFACLLFALL